MAIQNRIHLISIGDIIVAEGRQRTEFKNIDELAASIKRNGLIQPLVISPDNVLVAGERRLRACKQVGLAVVPCRYTSDLPKDELEIIELEENVKREDLTWKEHVAAVYRYYKLTAAEAGGKGYLAMSRALGISDVVIRRMILVQQAIEAGDKLVIEATSFTTAANIVARKEQREVETTASMVDSAIAEFLGEPKPKEKATQAVAAATTGVTSGPAAPQSADPVAPLTEAAVPDCPIINLDFKLLPKPERKFNFLHCDFPYGINFDSHNGGAAKLFGGYADTKDVYESLIEHLASIMDTHIATSAHIMFWCSARLDIIAPTAQALEAMGWRMQPVPLIWHRSDNSGVLPDPKRGARWVYETCLIGSRGDRPVVQAVSNLFAHPKTKEIHPSEKPRAMLQHFFRMFVDGSTVMLDPTCGSGNSVIAAEAAGAASALGLEIDKNFAELATKAWLNTLK